MRDVIVAANWKMHTTPADAGELARTIAARTRARRRDPRHLPAVRLPRRGPRRAGRVGPGRRRSAPRTSITSSRAPTPARSRRRCWSASRTGSSSATPSGGATPARPTSSSGASSARAVEAGLRPILCVGEQLDEREAGRQTDVVRPPARRRPRRDTTRRRSRAPAWSSPTSRSGRSARAATPAARTPRRWPTRSGPSVGESWPAGADDLPVLYGGSVTSANIAEFLAEPAIDGALVGGASLKPDEMAGIVARAGLTAAARGAAA